MGGGFVGRAEVCICQWKEYRKVNARCKSFVDELSLPHSVGSEDNLGIKNILC